MKVTAYMKHPTCMREGDCGDNLSKNFLLTCSARVCFSGLEFLGLILILTTPEVTHAKYIALLAPGGISQPPQATCSALRHSLSTHHKQSWLPETEPARNLSWLDVSW